MILKICSWLYHQPGLTALRESQFAYPAVQVVHVLGLVLMIGPVVLVDLRLLNLLFKREPAHVILGQLLPLSWIGFAILLISGPLLFAAQAEKVYANPFLQLKFLLLIVAGLNVAVFHRTTYTRVSVWGESGATPGRAKLAAVLSLALWVGVLSASHYIPYYEPR